MPACQPNSVVLMSRAAGPLDLDHHEGTRFRLESSAIPLTARCLLANARDRQEPSYGLGRSLLMPLVKPSMKTYTVVLAFTAALATPIWWAAQDAKALAQIIYKQASEAVVQVETRDANKKPTGQATAFVVGPGLLLTNAHAVAAASVWIRIGNVTIPARVERTDQLNDLALISVTGELAISALSLADRTPTTGARVFAIGNPKGRERTISEGLVAGVRVLEGRSLLQMSTPISPGSSGGPVLDEAAKVVGVAVGMLRDGQSLNFAVPADVVSHFLANEPTDLEAEASIDRAVQLLRFRRTMTKLM
jgi:S1-C subfamily serine protease